MSGGGWESSPLETPELTPSPTPPTDPFFPLSFLVNSWFPGMLDDLFQSLFLCALLLFWLCVYHGIRVQVSRLSQPGQKGSPPQRGTHPHR